jgi:uncharacterized protein (DUF58 family)
MYQPGDEPRYVDWKLLGRKDRLYVKQFEEETNLRAMVVLDASRSMDWSGQPEARLTKFDYARRLTAALALVLLRQRDATGLVVFDETVRATLPPRVSRAHWIRLAATLGNITPGRTTAAAPALQGVVERLRRRGLVVFVSDLLLDQAPALHALKFLRHRGHSVLVLHLLDPAELELDGPAEVRFEDPESSAAVVLRPRDWAEVYRQTVNDVVAGWRLALRREGIRYHAASSIRSGSGRSPPPRCRSSCISWPGGSRRRCPSPPSGTFSRSHATTSAGSSCSTGCSCWCARSWCWRSSWPRPAPPWPATASRATPPPRWS